jgi:isopropylmalate/homocitrate/citramalate synthase
LINYLNDKDGPAASNLSGGAVSDGKIVLIDGTLREGEQSAGVFFTPGEKIKLIRLMDKAGINIADCGMPAVSKDEFKTIKKLAALDGISIRIGASVRCIMPEIKLFSGTGASDCFIIVPVSDIHIKEKFKMRRGEYIQYVKSCVEYAGELKIPGIHLALEDMSRTDEEFYLELIGALADMNIKSLKAFYLCDTVGVALPEKIKYQAGAVLKILNAKRAPDNKDKAKRPILSGPGLGIHCHNDYGLALANTLSAFDAGANYLTFTQNGIGERAGNVKYHELIMSLVNLKKCKLKVDNSYLSLLSKTVEEISGIFVSASEPVVGYNAFRHESGIHVSGLLRNRKIYEEYKPEDIGKKNEFVLGKHTGAALIDKLLREHFSGVEFSRAEITQILNTVKLMRVSAKKTDYAAARRALINFYEKSLGGVQTAEFIKIVKAVLKLRKKHGS